MQVLKFGGSSVANSENINRVVNVIKEALGPDEKMVVVLSALGGITDALLEAVNLASQGDIRDATGRPSREAHLDEAQSDQHQERQHQPDNDCPHHTTA